MFRLEWSVSEERQGGYFEEKVQFMIRNEQKDTAMEKIQESKKTKF